MRQLRSINFIISLGDRPSGCRTNYWTPNYWDGRPSRLPRSGSSRNVVCGVNQNVFGDRGV